MQHGGSGGRLGIGVHLGCVGRWHQLGVQAEGGLLRVGSGGRLESGREGNN